MEKFVAQNTEQASQQATDNLLNDCKGHHLLTQNCIFFLKTPAYHLTRGRFC